jgi:DNA repair protein RecN (Recombination protein N)
MILSLNVRNLAVVEDVALDFSAGMSSLTGETGAGKSMLVDALSLVLGNRGDANIVRHGAERADISASFDIQHNSSLQKWLKHEELDDADNTEQCDLRRTISNEGRSRGYINGHTATLTQLRTVAGHTVDIHAQHAHQSLTQADTQRQLLDTAAGTQILLSDLATAYHQLQKYQRERDTLTQQNQDRTARLELLSYQVGELKQIELSDNHIQQLLQEQQQLTHATELIATAESGLNSLFDQEQGSAYNLITSLLNTAEKQLEIEPKFQTIVDTLNTTVIQLDECGHELRHYLDTVDSDPARLDEVETQLTTLHELARKHQVEIEGLPAHYHTLNDELNTLKNLGSHTESLQQQCQQYTAICTDLCQKISTKRQQAAPKLANKITDLIQQLAMQKGHIEIKLSPLEHLTASGADQVQWLVSTNPGQPAGELGKIASGGELARISLAIQVVTANSKTVPTLVFDEVDVGIGGGIAEIVGQHLRALSKDRQVICITHLPQVAAQAHQQLQVSKVQSKNSTHIEIQQLSEQQRIEEIARMLGGVKLTEKTRSHAEEMLQQAQS